MFLAGAVSSLVGEPESGKTWVALHIVAETLLGGGSALVIDVDHNGPAAIVGRLRAFGVPVDTLSDPYRFRLAEPDDPDEFARVVKDAEILTPDVVTVDSVGEVLPMYGANSNDADDYSRVHRVTFGALAKTGAAVLVIDHVAKSVDSRAFGASGSSAKKRAIDGIILRVTIIEAFTLGRGGKSALNILKDRHGAVRAASPVGDREPLAAVFEMTAHGNALNAKLWAPTGQTPNVVPPATVKADADRLDHLDPAPKSVRDVQTRCTWSSRRATAALGHWRNTRDPTA
ncbi:hypothetical protein C1I64_12685 [Rathayibacter festucae DSM 15932]|uniref:Uncharacterized protein n=1 Tax=Rathayibacter festucae DSM 15932 TaxID=1328866 RepID=A0A3Q9V0Q6_9MICO|nr:hypothetical protein C1I64_12685 [Rathayibacter festucae DSM 15932]